MKLAAWSELALLFLSAATSIAYPPKQTQQIVARDTQMGYRCGARPFLTARAKAARLACGVLLRTRIKRIYVSGIETAVRLVLLVQLRISGAILAIVSVSAVS